MAQSAPKDKLYRYTLQQRPLGSFLTLDLQQHLAQQARLLGLVRHSIDKLRQPQVLASLQQFWVPTRRVPQVIPSLDNAYFVDRLTAVSFPSPGMDLDPLFLSHF